MVKVIAYRESKWMPAKTDYRQWDHTCRAFGATLQMIDEWSEAIIPENHAIVLMDEAGEQSLTNFKHPDNAVYVYGRTLCGDISPIVRPDVIVRIEYSLNIPLFGVSACSITLYDRSMK